MGSYGVWAWPEGAQDAVIDELRAIDFDLSEIDDEEMRADAVQNIAGAVMRKLAPFVTQLVQKYDNEAYARGLKAVPPATDRTPHALADAVTPNLSDSRGKLTIKCESESESVLLAHELSNRGWRAKSERVVGGSKNDQGGIAKLHLLWAVVCTGQKKRGAHG